MTLNSSSNAHTLPCTIVRKPEQCCSCVHTSATRTILDSNNQGLRQWRYTQSATLTTWQVCRHQRPFARLVCISSSGMLLPARAPLPNLELACMFPLRVRGVMPRLPNDLHTADRVIAADQGCALIMLAVSQDQSPCEGNAMGCT